MLNPDDYRVRPDKTVNLEKWKPDDTDGLTKEEAAEQFPKLIERLQKQQELLYANAQHALLVVFQAMDTGGKDSTILAVFGPLNVTGCDVTSFKAPSTEERAHDFLWRCHTRVPRLGYISIFNRSYYEDVLIVRVKNLVPESRWKARYEHINRFEELLHDEGTTVVKFFLHISSGYQKERLQKRLDNPDKLWKFNPTDLVERERWADYQKAYEEALSRCTTEHAPWYIVPAEHRWFRDMLVAKALVETLEEMKMKFPKATFDPKTIVIP